MTDRELYEKASQAYSRLADLFHGSLTEATKRAITVKKIGRPQLG